MTRRILALAITLVGFGYVQPERPLSARGLAGSQSVAPAAPQTELIRTYCISCHNEQLKTGNLVLDKLDGGGLPADAAIGEKVLKKMRADAMPPAGAPRPDAATRTAFVSRLETSLDRTAAAVPNPGRPALHRLNRTEYVNAVRDLLALEIDGRALLPPDDSGYGFDNIADVLSLSPSLVDRYLIAAGKISRLAVGDPSMRPVVATYKLPNGLPQDVTRMSEDLPFGSRGGTVVRHQFPVDAEYQINVRLQRSGSVTSSNIRGLTEQAQIDLRVDGVRLKLFTLGGPEFRPPPGVQLPPAQDDDKVLVVRVPLKAGPRLLGVSFNKKGASVPEGRQPAPSGVKQALESITITGPFNAEAPTETPARRRIFACYPTSAKDEDPCARTILSTLARRAYRRPIAEADLRRLLAFYEAGRKEAAEGGEVGEAAGAGRARGFDAGIQNALQGVLSDPDFLVRVERDPANITPGGVYRISDLELASRLSFFLWSTIPDDELLALAERGRLKDPAVLAQQVRRMLNVSRPNAFLTNFFGQWLAVRNVASARPDAHMFPEFDENLRAAVERETELFLESQIREDHSAIDLLTANYTFLNERLARHYGIPGVYGTHFRRVTYPDDRRAGLLGHASVLMVTSYANRTSPVLRGKWILENILGAPPPPPPPNVPALKEDEPGQQPTSVRGRLEQHRKNPVCAACHARLDPMGFALENFDAVGKWRTEEGQSAINASGAFPTGEAFRNAAEFRKALLGHREEFVETVTEKILTYAIGRGVDYYDRPAIRAIVGDARAGDYRWSALITALVKSPPFQMRKADAVNPLLQARSGQ